LKTLVEAKTGLIVTDYSAALTATEAFGDYQHANKKGCIQFMNQLFEEKMFNVRETLTNVSQAAPETPSQPTDSMLVMPATTFPTSKDKPIVLKVAASAPNTPIEPVEIEMVSATASKQMVLPEPAKSKKAKRKKKHSEDSYGTNVDAFMLNR
jgi:hypothetical protein